MFKVLSYCDFCSKLHVAHEIWTQIRSHRLLDDSLCNSSNSSSQSSQCSWIVQCFHKLIIKHFIFTNKINQSIGFDLLTRAKPSTRAQSNFNSFLLEYSPACERTTLATERIWVGENDDDVSSLGVMPVPLGLAPLGPGSIGSSYCFELPFFFFSSLTLLFCSASFFQLSNCYQLKSLVEPLQGLAEGQLLLHQSCVLWHPSFLLIYNFKFLFKFLCKYLNKYRKRPCISRTFFHKIEAKNQGCGLSTDTSMFGVLKNLINIHKTS